METGQCAKPIKIKPDHQLINQWLSESSSTSKLIFNPIEWINVSFPHNEIQTHKLVRQCYLTIQHSCRGLDFIDGGWITLFECLETVREIYSQVNQKIEVIRQLDTTDDNQCAITILKTHCHQILESILNLTQLASTIEQLQRSKKLQLAQTYLTAIDTYFQILIPYQNLEIFENLKKEFCSSIINLRQLIFQTWDSHLESVDSMKNTKLSDLEDLRVSCLIIDQYYPQEVKINLIKWWVYIQILTYQQLLKRIQFTVESPFDSHYFWTEIKKFRKDHLFPSSWQVDLIYAYSWFSVTRPYLILSLNLAEKKTIEDHNALIAQNIALDHTEVKAGQKPEAKLDKKDKLVQFNIYPAIVKTLQFETLIINLWTPDLIKETLSTVFALSIDFKFKGTLSTTFDPYFSYCLDQDHNQFMTLINRLESAEQWDITTADSTAYFKEANDLCILIQKSLTKYMKIASIPVLLDLFKEYQTRLIDYLDLIEVNLPDISTNVSSQKLSADEVMTILVSSNTTSYINERLTNLIDSLKSILVELGASDEQIKQFSESKATLVENKCNQLGNLTVTLLADHINSQIKSQLLKIKNVKANVSKTGLVQIESPYIRDVIGVLKQELSVKTEMLNFSYLCQMVAQKLFETYLGVIRHPQFKMTETIAQQLLLDLSTMRQFMISGVIGLKTNTDPLSPIGDLVIPTDFKSYCKLIPQLALPIENLLKVMTTPNEKLIQTYRLFYTNATHKDIEEILDLRGLASTVRDQLIANYNGIQSIADQKLIIGKKDLMGKLSDLKRDIVSALP
jgi:hypothetical protein